MNAQKNKILGWIIRYRFGLLVVLVLAYFVLGPPIRRKLYFAGRDEPAANSHEEKPAPAQVPENESQISLYDPQSQDADPKWAALAGLNSDELRQFAQQTDQLVTNWHHKNYLLNCENSLLSSLAGDEVKNAIWAGTRDNTLKDKTLAADWTKAVKKVYDPVSQSAAFSLGMAGAIAHDVTKARLSVVQANVLGGSVVIGDVSFVKALGSLTDHTLSTLTNEVPNLKSIAYRVEEEFPSLPKDMAQLPEERPNDPFE
jgi:hypothetical protein